MSRSWLYILVLMMAGNYLTAFTGSLAVALLCDIGVLVAGYFIIRQDPWLNLQSNMIFLGCLTAINILYALGLISRAITNEGMLALILWSWFGLHSKVFRYFVIAAVVYNGVGLLQLYRNVGIIDIPTSLVSAAALLLVAYVDRDVR